jgi:hypothetical protein
MTAHDKAVDTKAAYEAFAVEHGVTFGGELLDERDYLRLAFVMMR